MAPRGKELVLARLGVSKDPSQRRRQLHIIRVLATLSLALLVETSRHLSPRPYHTSKLRGREWVQELLEGHPQRIKDNLGIHKYVFRVLCSELVRKGGLRPTKHVDVAEHVALFLWAAVTNLTNRHLAEKFQRSGSTISQYVPGCSWSLLL